MLKVISRYITFSIVLFAILSVLLRNIEGLRISVYIMFINNIIYALRDFKGNFLFFAFQLTFFVFLMGADFASMFAQSVDLKVNLLDQFPNAIKTHIYITLLLSLTAFNIGFTTYKAKQTATIKFDINSSYIYKLRKYSKNLMYLCSVFAILINLEKAIFVQLTGYKEFYLSYSSNLPFIVVKLATFYTTCFYIYLSTLPNRREANIPILLFLLINALTLGYGQRNGIMLAALFVLFYFIFRQKIKDNTDNDVWITKRHFVILLLSFPFILFFLYAYNYIRSDIELDTYESLFDNFLAFFYQQGGSIKIIGLEKEFSNSKLFPNEFMYSMGYIVDLFQQNFLFKQFNLYPSYPSQSYELAMYGHNFGATMTYLWRPDLYYIGIGLGSCYIAEIYHDFGYIGVFIINYIYGILLNLVNSISFKNNWSLFAIFIIIDSILYSPRSGALDFINSFFSISIVGLALLIHFYIIYINPSHKRGRF